MERIVPINPGSKFMAESATKETGCRERSISPRNTSDIIALSLYVALRRQVKLWRTFQLTVDEESVSRTQEAHATVVIRASEIQPIREAPRRGLTIVTQSGGVALSIPETLADYSECRALLARWAPIQTVRCPLNRVLLLAIAFVFMGGYVLFNRMHDPCFLRQSR